MLIYSLAAHPDGRFCSFQAEVIEFFSQAMHTGRAGDSVRELKSATPLVLAQ